MSRSKNLGADIIIAAKARNIDPFTEPFKPSELGIKASNYGSFSDWCDKEQTKSGKYNVNVCLTVAQCHNGKPFKYVLL